jgi:hypothetical protein
MLDAEADILSLDLDCFRLLQSYRQSGLAERAERAKEEAAKQKAAAELAEETIDEPPGEEPEVEVEPEDDSPKPKAFNVEKGDPWIDRVCELDGVEAEDLCKMHGKLIAAGFLNFQIRNRITGIEYRVATAGKQYLTKTLEQASEMAAESREDSEFSESADAMDSVEVDEAA